MQDSETRQLSRSRNVQGFAGTYPSAFLPAASRGAVLIADHVASIVEIEMQAAAQDAAKLDRQECTEQKDAAIEVLLTQMQPMNRIARSIDNLSPGIADQFKMPGNSDQAILNRARAYIVEATPIPTQFTSRGLPASFLTDLQAAIDAVVAALDRRAIALSKQTAATAGLRAAFKRERAIVNELDPIVRNHFRNDPAALAAWESAKHIERAPKKKTTPPPPSS